MARRPVGFNRRKGRSSRLDPRRQVEGGDIFQRRALKSALSSVERGSKLTSITKSNLGVTNENVGDFRNSLAKRLISSGRGVGSLDNRDALTRGRESLFGEQSNLAKGRQSLFGDTNRKQALFGARTSALNKKPFSDFQRRNLGINEDNEDEFRSLLKRRRR